MPAKKTTSRSRSTTTKRTKTARATTAKRATKKAAAKPETLDQMPVAEATEIAAPEAAELHVTEPHVEEPDVPEGAAPPVPAPAYTPMLTRVPTQAPSRSSTQAPSRGGDKRPSRYMGEAYLHATGPSERPVRRPGNWMIFISRGRVDALWETVRRAVEQGRLGHAAKVSTAVPNPLSPDPKKHVIYVLTADENDPADVRRVREALRQIGITWKIPYKSDATTRAATTKYFE